MADAQQDQTQILQLSVEQFPIIVQGARPGRAGKFEKSVAAINTALAEGEIPNPTFVEAKDWINRAVDEAYDRHVKDRFAHYDQPQDVQELSWSFMIMNLHDCKSAAKKVRASKATGLMVDAMRQFMDEVEPLWKAMDAVKPLIVKRKILTPEERKEKERYVPPKASIPGIVEVQAALQQVTEKKYEELVAIFERQFRNNVAKFEAAAPELRQKMLRSPDGRAGVCEAGDGGFNSRPYVRKPDFDKILNDMAVRRAKEIQDSFVFKNLKKLCSIVEKKADFESITEIGSSVSLDGLEGSFRVRFKDGASFKATNSVVYSRSVHNNPFLRFPLTFHEVVMADGSKMGKPSEERMNEVFAAPALPAGERDQVSAPKRSAGPSIG